MESDRNVGHRERKSYGLGEIPARVPRLYRFSEDAAACADYWCPGWCICKLSIVATPRRSDDELLSFAVASAEGNIDLICGFEMKSRSFPLFGYAYQRGGVSKRRTSGVGVWMRF